MKKRTSIRPHETIPTEIRELLGPPALLSTEDRRLYEKMLMCAAEDIRPTDIVGWILVMTLVHLFFEIARYRRLKVGWMQFVSQLDTLKQIATLEATTEGNPLLRDSIRAFRRESMRLKAASGVVNEEEEIAEKETAKPCPHIQRKIDELKKHRLTEEDLVRNLPTWINEIEQLDRLERVAENRLKTTRREIDDHLNGFGQALRERLDQVIEGEIIERDADSAPQEQPAMPIGTSSVTSLTSQPRTHLTREPLKLANNPRETRTIRARACRGR